MSRYVTNVLLTDAEHRQLMRALANCSVVRLYRAIGIGESVLRRAFKGEPISVETATKIRAYLGYGTFEKKTQETSR